MDNNITPDEFSKDLEATRARNLKPVNITLTAIEVFALVRAVQLAETAMPKLSFLGNFAKDTAKKIHNCLDPNSLLSLHLKEGWESAEVKSDFYAKNFPHETFLPETML